MPGSVAPSLRGAAGVREIRAIPLNLQDSTQQLYICKPVYSLAYSDKFVAINVWRAQRSIPGIWLPVPPLSDSEGPSWIASGYVDEHDGLDDSMERASLVALETYLSSDI